MLRVLNASIDRIPNEKLSFLSTNSFPTNLLPLFKDLQKKMPPVLDQGALGSSSAHAISTAYRFIRPEFTPSPLFVYFNARNSKNTPDESPVSIGDDLNNLQGFCSESTWPYDITKAKMKPSEACYKEADISGYVLKNIRQDLSSMLNAINDGVPFFTNIAVFPAFTNTIVAKTGKIPLPARDAKPIGGQTIVVCGYDARTQLWLCQNSWGTGWGEKGYFYLPFMYLLDSSLCSELWCIVKNKA